jgi:biofilm PGA synthesis N-glycosyltransferase PgaC
VQRLLLITPVFNEERHIERVVRAVAAQTRTPDRWIVADDGSTDGTLDILRRLAREVPFLEVVERPPAHPDDAGGDRLAVALEARAFNRALALADGDPWSHVGKLDGDIELPPEWFETLLGQFAANERLGLAGGTLVEPTPEGPPKRLIIPEYHVHGALKLFSRPCFEAVGGIQERLGWDTIDETYARMHGYETRSFRDLVGVHHRPAASADGLLRGRARHGECAYICHYPLGWVLLRAAKVALDPPRGLSGLAFVYGWLRAALGATRRVPDARFRAFTRQELRGRLVATLRSR